MPGTMLVPGDIIEKMDVDQIILAALRTLNSLELRII